MTEVPVPSTELTNGRYGDFNIEEALGVKNQEIPQVKRPFIGINETIFVRPDGKPATNSTSTPEASE